MSISTKLKNCPDQPPFLWKMMSQPFYLEPQGQAGNVPVREEELAQIGVEEHFFSPLIPIRCLRSNCLLKTA